VLENNALESRRAEPAEIRPVLAVDFGTSNTYVTKCPGDKEEPVGLDFGDGRDGIATAILYRGGEEPVIGTMALEEFGEGAADHPEYDIRTQFKPDLATSAEARRNARDFLVSLLELARRQNKDIAPAQRQVIFGAPSEASDSYRDALRNIARDAGFGEIKVVDEPKGAIYFHINRKDITPAEALRSALVVDFGGGTCDFALLVRGEVMHSWGDLYLGGRLFDDLFYQWFIDQNPDAVAAMRRERAEFFMLSVRSREAKEKFSLAMTLDRGRVFRRSMGEFGRIGEVTWDAFLQRASRYRPSETFAHYLQAMNPGAYEQLFATAAGLDLLGWFRRSLRQGLADERVRGRDLACVILTGGSSAWPFVAEIVEQELADLKPSPRLVQSDRPYVTVSQGLSIIPAFQVRLASTQTGLRAELPGFISDRIAPLIERRMNDSAERIAELVAAGLFDERIDPILRAVRDEGGSVAALKARIAEQAAAFKPEIERIVTTEIGKVLSGIAADTTELMQDWYRRHRLVVGEVLTSNGVPVALGEGLRIGDPNIYGQIKDIVWALSTTIVTVLVAVISGGAGTALIASGPVGLVVGAIIGLAAGALAMAYGVEEAKRRAEHWEGTPVWLLRRVLTDAKIAELRADIKTQVADRVKEQTDSARQALEEQIGQRVEQEIENLSAISQLL
jgi:molecular chaperone DnaK